MKNDDIFSAKDAKELTISKLLNDEDVYATYSDVKENIINSASYGSYYVIVDITSIKCERVVNNIITVFSLLGYDVSCKNYPRIKISW